MNGHRRDQDFRAMVQDLWPAGSASGSLPHEQGSRIKTIVIILLAMAVLAVGGGSFYYFQIYRPTQYARAIIRIYDAAMAEGRAYGTSALKDSADYAGARDVIRKQRLLAEQVKGELALLDSPPAMTGVSRTFKEFLELNLAALAETEPRAEFLAAAADFRAEMKKFTAVLQPELPSAPSGAPARPPTPPTAGAVRLVWEEAIPHLQSFGSALVRKEPSGLVDPSFTDLRQAWQKAEPGLSVLLAIIRKLNPQSSIATVPQNVSPEELKRSEAAFADLGILSNLIERVLDKANATDLLSFRTFPRQAELSERAFELYQTTENLRKRYDRP
ncbi:MAG: hypothetical protein A3B37_01945 [Candidatus Sungbacteria bacterium RIFCSPLOWO2_01_FULL_59_16]|uniref:Uncharacterized protein n=1 Tax=Candidatus Sungbacteria bacterium RIFCSPLOWO2_01_FULL_59_16 TaxID=1802280 RepID=A0A1G2LD27_9BACT|nr:MAG: hypothetical protein A3B37_01945 [Candidatus Sungbacteria bacterium RIFCSPLOWO2_01_FULL_59_16]